MTDDFNKFGAVFAQPIIAMSAMLRVASAFIVASSTSMDKDEAAGTEEFQKRRGARTAQDAECDARLSAAFSEFERRFAPKTLPRSAEQLRIINTPLGFDPK